MTPERFEAPVKVGIDLHTLTGAPQGMTTVWLSMLEALSPRFEYWLFSHDPETTRRLLPQAHFRHARIPHHSRMLRLFWDLPRLARRHGCDVLHVNYVAPLWFAPPIVLTIHDLIYLDFPEFSTGIRRHASATLGRLSARRAAVVTTVSEYSRGRIAALFGIPPKQILLVPNALGNAWSAPDESAIARADAALEARLPNRYLLTVGRLDPRKNIAQCAREARRLHDAGLIDGLVVIGSDDFGAATIREELRRDGTDHLLTHLQGLDITEVQAVYRRAALLLYLSLAEGFGLPLLEAMSMGVPIVASNRTAVPEVCAGAAVLVDPDDEEEVHRAVHTLLTNPGLAADLRKAGCRRARDYDIEEAARLMEKAYLTAARRGRP
jgi:glycosyltransferase involved in cell wall biosynthesis